MLGPPHLRLQPKSHLGVAPKPPSSPVLGWLGLPPPSPPLPTSRSHQAPLPHPPRCPWGLRAAGRQAAQAFACSRH